MVQGSNGFAFRFTNALMQQSSPEENFVCSPFSAWLPLAALVNATEASRQPELLEALGAAGIEPEMLNAAAREMLNRLNRDWSAETEEGAGNVSRLSIANAVFVDRKAELSQEFADIFARDYDGAAMSVDFASSEAAEKINAWASEQTEGLIDQIVSPDMLDPDTAAALANALYFSDRWDWEFSPEDTRPDTFHAPGGDIQAQFMLRDGRQPYMEDESLQALRLDFARGGSLLILLPKDGDAASLLQGTDEAKLTELLGGLQERTGRLLLPRFELENGPMNLLDVLAALGVPLTDSIDACITGLAKDKALYISEAVQKAVIKADEKGTTAAAVTVMAMTEGAMLVEEPEAPFVMDCNHPFAFALLGDSAGGQSQVLFTGVVNDPGETD